VSAEILALSSSLDDPVMIVRKSDSDLGARDARFILISTAAANTATNTDTTVATAITTGDPTRDDRC
jgi:hypothetical protein